MRALALAEELGAREVELLLDSKLIVEQVHGRWRVKDAKLIPLHAEVKARLARFSRWSATHVPRAQNKQADALCNEAIDRAQAGGPRRWSFGRSRLAYWAMAAGERRPPAVAGGPGRYTILDPRCRPPAPGTAGPAPRWRRPRSR